MNFYHILFALKKGFNRNLTWYENLFVKFYNTNLGKLIAKLLKIKGNTIVWNQLVRNGNFDGELWWITYRNAVLSASGNVGTVTCTADDSLNFKVAYLDDYKAGHKYYFSFECNSNSNASENVLGCIYGDYQHILEVKANDLTANVWNKRSYVLQAPNANVGHEIRLYCTKTTITNKYRNIVFIDLTQLGLDTLTAGQFEALFSLPYYDYCQGKLLSFNGTGIKTTGKNFVEVNQVDTVTQEGSTLVITPNGDGTFTLNGTSRNSASVPILNFKINNATTSTALNNEKILPNGTYKIPAMGIDGCKVQVLAYNSSSDATLIANSQYENTFVINNNFKYNLVRLNVLANITFNNFVVKPLIVLSDVQDLSYEPYTSNTKSLPISTYFPTGMKSAGNVYDELTPDKAITRVGSYTFTGTENFFKDGNYRFATGVDNIIPIKIYIADSGDNLSKAVCNNYEVVKQSQVGSGASKKIAFSKYGTTTFIYFSVDGMTDPSELKTWLQNNPATIYFELATPTEITIDPPLDLSYPIEWGGTEQLLPENTSVPTTSPILADMHYPDGDRADQQFTYREIEKNLNRNNRALSIMLGRNVWTDEPQEPLDILLKGE